MKFLTLIFINLFLINTASMAKVTAIVDRSEIVIGETFILKISVDKNTNEQPDLTELQQAFKVLGISQSSSSKNYNGSYSIEKAWEITLMTNVVGENAIPPIKLGSEISDPIKITVTKSDPNAKANGDVFIEISADKKTAFVKEQIILTLKLFYSINLSEGNLSEPTAPNTIISQLDKGSTYTTNRDGKNYTVVERHYVLFAEKNGKLELNPIIFNGRDNSSRRSFSMFSTGKPIRAISKPISFNIKPIPQDSIGKDWIPASKVQVSQQWSKQPYKIGEPITRTITLYIEGLNDTQIPDIDLGDIKDVRIYPEQPQTQTEKTSQTLKTYKQVKIAMIPIHAGSIRIPEYSLEWYNTKTDKVEYAKLPPMTIKVEEGEFALDVPKSEDIFAKPKQTNKVSETKQPQESKNITVVKENPLWKYLTALFALLWIVTMIIYLKKPKQNSKPKIENKVPNLSKNQILYAIENRDIVELQTVLINWWNQQHPDKATTNLSQIKKFVDKPMQELLIDLELQLYDQNKKISFNKTQWQDQVKGNGLNVIKSQNSQQKTELPKLYS